MDKNSQKDEKAIGIHSMRKYPLNLIKQTSLISYDEYKERVKQFGIKTRNASGNLRIFWFRIHAVRMLPEKVQTILDIGCNDGVECEKIKEITEAEIIGLEVAPNHVKSTRQKGFECFQGDFETIEGLPVVDCIYISHTLEHLYDLDKALDKIYDLTNKWLIVVLPLVKESLPDEQFNAHAYGITHFHIGTEAEWLAIIGDHNFALIDSKTLNSEIAPEGAYLFQKEKRREK